MKKSLRTKQYIIEQTAGIFNRMGYKGTSMSALTAATGMTKGAIYGNFSGKEDLALAVFDYNFEKLRLELQTRLKEAPDAPSKLRVYIDHYRKAFKEEKLPTGGCPLLNTGIEADDEVHPALLEKVKAALKIWELSLIHIVEKGQAKKQLKSDFKPSTFASLFISLIEGALFFSKTSGEYEHLKNALEHLDFIIDQYSHEKAKKLS